MKQVRFLWTMTISITHGKMTRKLERQKLSLCARIYANCEVFFFNGGNNLIINFVE